MKRTNPILAAAPMRAQRAHAAASESFAAWQLSRELGGMETDELHAEVERLRGTETSQLDAIETKPEGSTERRRAESRLAETQARLGAVLDEIEERAAPAEHRMTRAQLDEQRTRQRGSSRRTDPNLTPAMLNESRAGPSASARLGTLLPRNAANPSTLIFGRADDPRHWKNADEFFHAVANRLADPRLIANATNVEGVGQDGGFIVPSHWYRELIDGMLQAAQLVPRCRVFGTPSNNITIPMLDTSDRRTSIAGIAAQWAAEGQQGQSQKLKFRLVETKLGKVLILAESSGELLEDGIGYEQQLMTAMNASTSYTLDDAIIAGDGVGKPLGILSAPSTITIDPESGQAADTVLYQNIVNMFARMHPACARNGVWFYSQAMLPQLLSLTIPGTDGHPVLLSGGPNDAAAGAPAQTIFGRPALSNECMPGLGDRGDLIFVDLAQYGLLLKSSARIAFDGGPGFDRDVATWRLTLRVNGLPLWASAVTPRDGGPTLSWATVLGARAG